VCRILENGLHMFGKRPDLTALRHSQLA